MTHAPHDADAGTSRLAFQATIHCLTGCGIGEVLGLGGATLLGLGNLVSLVLGIVLAYAFGYGLTLVPLLRAGMPLARASGITLAAETLSITTMEIVDNAVVIVIPGSMDAGLGEILFWASLAISLALAFVAAYPVNRWLVARGLGHAIVHGHHS
ncbi:MAG: hypothetical protein AUH33_01010 [Chloroflexi bacterium 13_1_40CM_68_21]|nr:MAG: hypothetical protein AUH33_01010 [Chloroflexi bacterium 13_1_40CM_68_21]